MFKYKVTVIVFLALLMSCKTEDKKRSYKNFKKYSTIKNKKNPDLIKIDIPEGELLKELKNSSIIDSVKYVKLETNNHCLFGQIDKMIVYDGSIFILDAINTKSLLEFSVKGKFIRKYGEIGKGPNEYLRPNSFGIDEKNNRIIIFDDKSSKILFFNRDGSVLKEQKLSFYTREVGVLGENQLFFNNRKAPNINSDLYANYLTLVNSEGEILSKGLPFNEDIINLRYHSRNDFVKTDKELLYHPALSDTIYSVNKEEIKAKYVLNFGDKKLPKGYDVNSDFREFKDKYKRKDKPFSYLLGEFMEVDNKLYFQLSYQGYKITCLYSIKTGKLKFGGKFLADLNNDLGTFSPIGVYKNGFVSLIEPNMVINKKGLYNDESINKIINSTSQSDNPILSFQHLKDF